jgi:hypothetical protein
MEIEKRLKEKKTSDSRGEGVDSNFCITYNFYNIKVF